MTDHEFAALENSEFRAMADFYRAAPEATRAAYAVDVQEVAGVTCMKSRGIEPAVMFRRAAGLGVGREASEAEAERVLAHMSAGAQRYAVPLAAHARPAALAAWLEKRGFTRGYAWMKFSRPCHDAPHARTDLEIRVAGRELGAEFGRVVVEGFGLPAAMAPWIAALAGRQHWVCVMAFADGKAVGSGAVYVDGEHAWLGLGATLASHRRLGAQNALLARRLKEAAARGAKTAVTETGERVPDKPSTSYGNILRAGFRERYLRQNYLSPAK